jgi:hypothetical protein
MSYKYQESLAFERQSVQARVANVAILLHAWICTLSRLDSDYRKHGGNGAGDLEIQRDKAAALHFFDLAEVEIHENLRALYENGDDTMLAAAAAAMKHNDSLPNSDYIISERSPNAKGTGRTPRQDGIKQFPGEKYSPATHASHA